MDDDDDADDGGSDYVGMVKMKVAEVNKNGYDKVDVQLSMTMCSASSYSHIVLSISCYFWIIFMDMNCVDLKTPGHKNFVRCQ